MPAVSPTKRYRQILQRVRDERGEFCEACQAPARHAHHIIPVGQTGISAGLVYEPANMMILCPDCHLLMHPGIRNTDWATVRRARGVALR